MRSRFSACFVFCLALVVFLAVNVLAQGGAQTNNTQNEFSAVQRMDVMRSKLDGMRRSLSAALSSLPAKNPDEKKNLDDPRVRLQNLDKEAGSLMSELANVRGKQDRSERYDPTTLDRMEASVAELNTRVETALQQTASARATAGGATATASAPSKKKKKGKLFGLFGGGDSEKYEELTGTVAPGRDRVLFEEAAKEVRKGQHETGRLLFSTIINTYPDSAFLPLAKLAIADSFYLEGTSSSLIQAAQAYQDWLTFFPTDPLAPYAMLKVAESEMRQMGLSDRDITHARKAEQRLKALLQQYPNTSLRSVVEDRLIETQESLAMHGYQIADFYMARYDNHKGGLKGAQSRLKEVNEKYPNFSERDGVLFKLAYTYQQEEEPDEAAKYYQELLRYFPNSTYADKAKEQLSIIGAPVPEPDPTRRNVAPAERPGMVGSLVQQFLGKADVTVSTDGILISKNKQEGRTDLIDEALKYNGQLPTNVTPVAPVQRNRTVPQNPAPRPTTPNSIQPPTSTPATQTPGVIKP
ncbi:MAG TPA: outer membrane protein assembly factor BamD [Pyrinomonadaceae bacterium]|nr:outer membrane protein assembly factor BamD [Pyrinomonadaceae bacterium]